MADEDIKNGVLDILADLTGSDDVKKNLDLNLFETGLLDYMGTVLLSLERLRLFGVDAPVTEFDRKEWDTHNKNFDKVETAT